MLNSSVTMAPPFIVFVIPGFALIFFVQMLLCEAYHFHVTLTRHKKYARGPANGVGKSVKFNSTKPTQEVPPEREGSEPGGYTPSATESSAASGSIASDDDSEDRMKLRRKSVFAESYDPSTDDDYVKIVHPKTQEEKQWLIENLGNITLFRHLAQDQIMTVVDAMYKVQVSAGETIMKQGDKGNIFYVIQSGVFNVLVTDSNGKQKLMHTYSDKGSFGELALLYNQPRAATIVAQTDGVLWAVDGQTFRRIVHKITYEKRVLYESLINNVPMLKTLKPFECSNLVDALVPRIYQDEEVVIKQGDKADGMYFVISGNVRLEVKTDTGKDAILKSLKAGEYFGELGLLTNQPRAASAYSVGKSNLAFLDREAFERLLGPCMDIMQRNIRSYKDEMEGVIHDDLLG